MGHHELWPILQIHNQVEQWQKLEPHVFSYFHSGRDSGSTHDIINMYDGLQYGITIGIAYSFIKICKITEMEQLFFKTKLNSYLYVNFKPIPSCGLNQRKFVILSCKDKDCPPLTLRNKPWETSSSTYLEQNCFSVIFKHMIIMHLIAQTVWLL